MQFEKTKKYHNLKFVLESLGDDVLGGSGGLLDGVVDAVGNIL